MSYQWDVAQPMDQQDITVGLDPNDFLDYNPYAQYFPSDQIGQLLATPDYGSLATMNLDTAAWQWQECTDSLGHMQDLEMQPDTTVKEAPVDEGQLKDMMAEIRHGLEKSEENTKNSIIKWEEMAKKQEEAMTLRLNAFERTIRDLEHELEEERAKLCIELRCWAEEVKDYVDKALSFAKSNQGNIARE